MAEARASAPPPEEKLAALHREARELFTHSLEACRIERVLPQRIRREDTTLVIERAPTASEAHLRIPLEPFDQILIVAIGKAAVPLTQGLLAILPHNLEIRGICAAPSLPAHPDPRILYYAGGHPLPNQDSFRAARSALDLLRRATGRTLVLYLISGGGSTLFDLPLDPEITLADTIAFHQALINSGATIAEINTLRKHFSAVKGGRLADAAGAASKLTLQVLDVPSRDADSVASGPTLPDRSSVADCRELLARYQLLPAFPESVRRFFSRPNLPETPGPKEPPLRDQPASPDSELASPVITLLSNDHLLEAAKQHALRLGYEVVVDNHCDDWPSDQAAHYLVTRLLTLRSERSGRRICLLSGGEVTVKIDRPAGSGGRNQHFALTCALLLEQRMPHQPVVCLSAGSDGVDGNSQAAGALVDTTTTRRARALGLNPAHALAAFDSGTLLSTLGDSILTGPTGNNLRDLRIFLLAKTAH
ncbi:MAG: D-glycerate 2-kinase [Acidobacteriaceae bacterium]|nr:D-glycerate 2-kinase [Acidobacteriaceae bacterium]